MLNYLIVEDFSGQPAPFLFPLKVSHADMRDQLPYGKILSCGMVAFSSGKLSCAGGCQELCMEARPEVDAAIISSAFAPL